jgi:hypothetical protein
MPGAVRSNRWTFDVPNWPTTMGRTYAFWRKNIRRALLADLLNSELSRDVVRLSSIKSTSKVRSRFCRRGLSAQRPGKDCFFGRPTDRGRRRPGCVRANHRQRESQRSSSFLAPMSRDRPRFRRLRHLQKYDRQLWPGGLAYGLWGVTRGGLMA